MSYISLLGYFIIYSFLGWIGDTAVRSLTARRYLPGSFFPAPICPIYGVGAILILVIAPYASKLPLIWQGIGYGLLLAGLEYVTGVLILTFFNRRLWAYKSRFLNLSGFTDFTHVVIWGILAILFLNVGHPFVENVFQGH